MATWITAASQPIHQGMYPYLASPTEFLMYTRHGLAGSVLIGIEGQYAQDVHRFATVVLWFLAVRPLATISWVFHGC